MDASLLRSALEHLVTSDKGSVKHQGMRRTHFIRLLLGSSPVLGDLARVQVRQKDPRQLIGRGMDIDALLATNVELPPGDVLIVGNSWRANVNKANVRIIADEPRTYYVLATAQVGDALDAAYTACGSDIEQGVKRLGDDVINMVADAMRQSACGRIYRPRQRSASNGGGGGGGEDDTATIESPPAPPPHPSPPAPTALLAAVGQLIDMFSGPWFTSAAGMEKIEAEATGPWVGNPYYADALATPGVHALRLAAAIVVARNGDPDAIETVRLATDLLNQRMHYVGLEHSRFCGAAVDKDAIVMHLLRAHWQDYMTIVRHADPTACIADRYMTVLDVADPEVMGPVPSACRACVMRAHRALFATMTAERACDAFLEDMKLKYPVI
jgi:hypothetical protein